MGVYSATVERQMIRFYGSLNERDRRRYAGVEASKLGHGGIEYIAQLLDCDPKTIGHGVAELEAQAKLGVDRQRKKGAGVSR